MRWERFIDEHAGRPVIFSANLRIQHRGDSGLAVQMSRWKKSGRLISLKRGVYLLNPLYAKTTRFEPFLAQTLLSPSYISLEKALEYHGLIPEGVPVVTSITTKQPRRFTTPIGTFRYYHLDPQFFWGYEPAEKNNQAGFIALPEKALLDYLYLRRSVMSPAMSPAFFQELRLQNLDRLNLKRLGQFSDRFGKPALTNTVLKLLHFIKTERSKDKLL